MKHITLLLISVLMLNHLGLSQQVEHDFNWVPFGSHYSSTTTVDDCAQSITLTMSEQFKSGNNPNISGQNSVVTLLNPTQEKTLITIRFGLPIKNLALRIGDLDFNATPISPNEFLNNFFPKPDGVTPPLIWNGSSVETLTNNEDGWIYWSGKLSKVSFTYNRPIEGFGLYLDSLIYECMGCCHEETNLITNGDFESHNNVISKYKYSPQPTLPGQYSILDHSDATNVCDNWDIKEPNCDINGKFMVVNGRTNQPAFQHSEIWSQSLKDIPTGDYEFCVNLKNLAGCCFDSKPEVSILIGHSASKPITISTNSNDPCDWRNIIIPYHHLGGNLIIELILFEDGKGDGNDLAIDNIIFSPCFVDINYNNSQVNHLLSKKVVDNLKLSLFPNPANDLINISITNPNNKVENIVHVMIYDLNGVIVLDNKIVNNQFRIKQLLPGMYIAKMISSTKQIITKKITVKKF